MGFETLIVIQKNGVSIDLNLIPMGFETGVSFKKRQQKII